MRIWFPHRVRLLASAAGDLSAGVERQPRT